MKDNHDILWIPTSLEKEHVSRKIGAVLASLDKNPEGEFAEQDIKDLNAIMNNSVRDVLRIKERMVDNNEGHQEEYARAIDELKKLTHEVYDNFSRMQKLPPLDGMCGIAKAYIGKNFDEIHPALQSKLITGQTIASQFLDAKRSLDTNALYVGQKEYAVVDGGYGLMSSQNIGTDNVQDCVCLILHKPGAYGKTLLAHIDVNVDSKSIENCINNNFEPNDKSKVQVYMYGARFKDKPINYTGKENSQANFVKVNKVLEKCQLSCPSDIEHMKVGDKCPEEHQLVFSRIYNKLEPGKIAGLRKNEETSIAWLDSALNHPGMRGQLRNTTSFLTTEEAECIELNSRNIKMPTYLISDKIDSSEKKISSLSGVGAVLSVAEKRGISEEGVDSMRKNFEKTQKMNTQLFKNPSKISRSVSASHPIKR